jgi:NitT/TauT family transport system substrate-binding protein
MHITLIENFRAVFYTPFYAALSLRAFAAQGLEVEIRASPDPAQTLQQLVSGADTVSWGGPMRLLRSHDADPASEAVAFCEAVGRDPFFLIGRVPNPGYRPADLVGKRLAVVSEVPTPWICLQHDLRRAGVAPEGIGIAAPRTMADNAAALRAGAIDVVQVFEPYARELVAEGCGHVWHAAAMRGPTSYTSLNTTRDFIARNPQAVAGMTRAMYRTLRWMAAHDGAAVADLVSSWFPQLPRTILAACCSSYQALGVWNASPLLSRAGFDWLRDAMLASGDIGRRVEFEECVDMRFAQAVVAAGL